jgi:hypothetical protein
MSSRQTIYGYVPPVELKPQHCGLTGCGFECRFAGMNITPASISAAYLRRIHPLGDKREQVFPNLADGRNIF